MQTKASLETDMWVEALKWYFKAVFFFFFGMIEGGARQKAPPSLENGRLCNTASLSHRKVRLTFQKSASAAPGPHRDDTSPPLQSHASDPFYTHTQLSKNTRQFFRHNGTEAHCAAKGQQPPVPAVFNRNSMLLKFFYVQPRFKKRKKKKRKGLFQHDFIVVQPDCY